MPQTRSLVVVANRTYAMSFQTLANFAQAVHDALSAPIFANPPVTLVQLQTDIDAMQAAINAWGTILNRGSHADYITLLAATQTVSIDLASLGGFVQTIARNSSPGDYNAQKTVVLLAAMRVKDDANRLALWGPVNNFRPLIKQNLQGTGIVQLKWDKPNVVPGANSRPPTYNVYSSTDNLTFNFLASTSSTTYLDNIGTGNSKYYKIAPVSAAGVGGMSPSIQAFGL